MSVAAHFINSTISSESVFSTTGRIVEERCRSLGSDMVEMLALLKDWEQGDAKDATHRGRQ